MTLLTKFWKPGVNKLHSFPDSTASIYKNTQMIHTLKDGNWRVYSFENDTLIAASRPKKKEKINISFSKISGLQLGKYWFDNDENKIKLGIGFRTLNGQSQIAFSTPQDQLPLFKDDCITIMFRNRTALTFVINTPTVVNKKNNSTVMSGFTDLTLLDLQKMMSHESIGWHYFSHENPETYNGNFSQKQRQVLQEMSCCYLQVLKKHAQF